MLQINWKFLSATIALRTQMMGGTPTDPRLIEGWIKANMPAHAEALREKLKTATLEELGDAVTEKAEGMWTTFKRDSTGVYIEGRQMKALLKETANILRDSLTKAEGRGRKKDDDGEEKKSAKEKSRFTALRSKVAEKLFVQEERIYFTRNGEHLLKPDGSLERAIHVQTAQGPRNALKRSDYIEPPAKLNFTLRYLEDGVIDLELVRVLLEYGEWNGLGADRSQGFGLYEVVELREFTPAAKAA